VEFYDRLKISLEKSQKWPGTYLFKFIVPTAQKAELLALLPLGSIQLKESRGSKYLAVSLTSKMTDATEVIQVYQKVSTVTGIVSL
jgi:hypothetical protein